MTMWSFVPATLTSRGLLVPSGIMQFSIRVDSFLLSYIQAKVEIFFVGYQLQSMWSALVVVILIVLLFGKTNFN